MPSFDITSEANIENMRNAVDVSMRIIDNRYDFKGTTAKIDFIEKEMVINLFGDAEFQLNQIKDILFPAMEKKEPDSSKRITSNIIESITGNKSKQVLEIKSGIDMDLTKKIVKTIKDAKNKTQANIQGDAVRVSGGKRDLLQECIALVKAKHNDFPLNFGNFRD